MKWEAWHYVTSRGPWMYDVQHSPECPWQPFRFDDSVREYVCGFQFEIDNAGIHHLFICEGSWVDVDTVTIKPGVYRARTWHHEDDMGVEIERLTLWERLRRWMHI